MVVAVGNLAASALLQAGAVPTPVLRLDLHGSGPRHGARAAVRVAGRPGTPRCHLTVHHWKIYHHIENILLFYLVTHFYFGMQSGQSPKFLLKVVQSIVQVSNPSTSVTVVNQKVSVIK